MKRITFLVLLAATVVLAQRPTPNIPRTWDLQALADLQLPLAHADASPQIVDPDTYYSIPAAPIYKSYPVYHPDNEPPGYLDWLQRQEPEIVVPAAGLLEQMETETDWIRVGKLVFDTQLPPFVPLKQLAYLRERQFYEHSRTPLTRDGVMPFLRYIVREKGRIEISGGCSMCHTRVLPDGTTITGAQGNNTLGAQNAYILRNAVLKAPNPAAVLARIPILNPAIWLAPWLEQDPNARIAQLLPGSQPAVWESMPPGVIPRHSGLVYPAAIPDLIGLKDRRYFDRTGFIQHRSIGDLMRYAALVQGIDRLDTFGKYVPARAQPSGLVRYSDEQLYALASMSTRSSRLPIHIWTIHALRPAARYSESRVALGVTRRPYTPTTRSRPLPALRSLRGMRGNTTFIPLGLEPILAWRSKRAAEPVTIRSLRLRASGIEAPWAIVARSRRWKIGSIPCDFATTTHPPVSRVTVSPAGPFPATSSAWTCRPKTKPLSSLS